MIKSLISTTLVAISLLAASMAFAEGPGWTANSKILKIVVTANGGVNVRLVPELTACTSQGGYGPNYASVYPTQAGIDRIHALLLTAYTSDKPIALYLSDSTCKVVEVELGGR